MVQVGQYNLLRVARSVPFGVYLEGDDEHGDILLPQRYVPEGCEPGDDIEVFIYLDSSDRIIATTEKPYATVGTFAYLRVVSTSGAGAFVDWGLSKDLLVPMREQQHRMENSRSYVVYVYLDKVSGRIVGSSRLRRYVDTDTSGLSEGQEVDLLIAPAGDLGHNAIINGCYMGVLYRNEVFQKLQEGMQLKGYIRKIREDGKIDLSLQPSGFERVEELTDRIMAKLKAADGRLYISDKSMPELIYQEFGCSKKAFKMATGTLYKQRLIRIEPQMIELASRGT